MDIPKTDCPDIKRMVLIQSTLLEVVLLLSARIREHKKSGMGSHIFTVDASDIPGYQNMTEDDFAVVCC